MINVDKLQPYLTPVSHGARQSTSSFAMVDDADDIHDGLSSSSRESPGFKAVHVKVGLSTPIRNASIVNRECVVGSLAVLAVQVNGMPNYGGEQLQCRLPDMGRNCMFLCAIVRP